MLYMHAIATIYLPAIVYTHTSTDPVYVYCNPLLYLYLSQTYSVVLASHHPKAVGHVDVVADSKVNFISELLVQVDSAKGHHRNFVCHYSPTEYQETAKASLQVVPCALLQYPVAIFLRLHTATRR